MAYIGKEPIVGNFQKCDAITVVNGQAAYTLQVSSTNVVPESANHMLVSLNGILQAPVTSFTVSGSTLTFASNLATGDVIDFVILLGNVLDLGTVSDGTITNAKLAQDIISAETALASEPADTDEFLVSDAGTLKRIDYSLIKGGGGLVHLQTQTVSSGVSSVDFTSNIDSTYAAYKLIGTDLRCDTDQAEVKIRYGAGSFQTSNYGRAAIAREASGSTTTGNSASSADGILMTNQNAGNAADESLSFECILANPSNTDAHKIVYGLAGYIGADNDLCIHMFSGHYNSDTAAVTRIQVLPSSGNIDGGTFSLFGVSKG